MITDFDDLDRQPAKQFEVQTGLNGIAGHYRFPGKVTAAQYEDIYTRSWNHDGTIRPPAILRSVFMRAHAPAPHKTFDYPPQYLPLLQRAWKNLIKLNPELKRVIVKQNDREDLRNAFMGVTSGFSVTDINYFLALLRKGVLPAAHSRAYPWYLKMWEDISQKTGHRMYWVAAPATLMKVERKLGLRR